MKLRQAKRVLKNGLTVVSVPMETESVAAVLLVRVGSRDEGEKINGISHFLEHMVFKATKKWPSPMKMNQVIDSVGGVYNAFTARENTGFWVKLHKKHLKLGLEFLKQAVFDSLLPGDELERERGVILEEIKMYEDNPMSKVARSFVSQIYRATVLGRQVIGEPENIKALKREEFYEHLKKWYQPKNMVLGVAGGLGSKVEGRVGEVFSGLGKSRVLYKEKPKKLSFSQEKAVVEVVNKDIQQAHFCLGLRSLKRDDKDRYALAALNTILGGNTSSRLWHEIREKRGLVYYIRSMASGFFETGHLVTQAGCDIGRVEEAIEVTRGEYEKMRERLVTREELSLAKEFLKGRLALSLEDSHEVAGLMAEDLLMEDKMRTIEEIEKGVEAVRVTDVQRVGKKIFNSKGLNLTVVGPFEEKAQFEKLLK